MKENDDIYENTKKAYSGPNFEVRNLILGKLCKEKTYMILSWMDEDAGEEELSTSVV